MRSNYKNGLVWAPVSCLKLYIFLKDWWIVCTCSSHPLSALLLSESGWQPACSTGGRETWCLERERAGIWKSHVCEVVKTEGMNGAHSYLCRHVSEWQDSKMTEHILLSYWVSGGSFTKPTHGREDGASSWGHLKSPTADRWADCEVPEVMLMDLSRNHVIWSTCLELRSDVWTKN